MLENVCRKEELRLLFIATLDTNLELTPDTILELTPHTNLELTPDGQDSSGRELELESLMVPGGGISLSGFRFICGAARCPWGTSLEVLGAAERERAPLRVCD